MSTYPPLQGDALRSGTCHACGQRAFVHEAGGRCYTFLELEAALRFMQTHRRWPFAMLAPPPEETA